MKSEKRIYVRNPDMVSRAIDGSTILLPVCRTSDGIDCIYTLNQPAAWVWNNIDGKTGADAIAVRAEKEFSSKPEEIAAELETLFAELLEIKAITLCKNLNSNRK